MPTTEPSVNVLALLKPNTGETYICLFADSQVSLLGNSLGRWAANPDLSFTWYDAAVLIQKARQAAAKAADAKCRGRF